MQVLTSRYSSLRHEITHPSLPLLLRQRVFPTHYQFYINRIRSMRIRMLSSCLNNNITSSTRGYKNLIILNMKLNNIDKKWRGQFLAVPQIGLPRTGL